MYTDYTFVNVENNSKLYNTCRGLIARKRISSSCTRFRKPEGHGFNGFKFFKSSIYMICLKDIISCNIVFHIQFVQTQSDYVMAFTVLQWIICELEGQLKLSV